MTTALEGRALAWAAADGCYWAACAAVERALARRQRQWDRAEPDGQRWGLRVRRASAYAQERERRRAAAHRTLQAAANSLLAVCRDRPW